MTAKSLANHDIVLTTYWELSQSHPNPDKNTRDNWRELAKKKKKKDEEKFDWYAAYFKWAEDHKNVRGLLHQIHWYRVSTVS